MDQRSLITESTSDLSLAEKQLPILPRYVRALSQFQQKCKALVRYWWAWELLAAAVSIIATINLIVVLAVNNGKSLQAPLFGYSQFSLNGLVAAISTVVRTSLLLVVGGALNQCAWNWFSIPISGGRPLRDLEIFGSASSDSFSSLKLLLRTRGKALAALGAAVVILSLGFDFFAQEVLTTKNSLVPSISTDPASTLPRCLAYTGQFELTLNEEFTKVPVAVNGALLTSFFAPNSTFPTASCATGNCTWPISPSLGLCSSCIDVKNQTTVNQTNQGVAVTQPVPPHTNGDVLGQSIYLSSNNLSEGFNSAINIFTSTMNTDYATNTVGARLTAGQIQLVGIPASNYDRYISSYGAGQPPDPEGIQRLIVSYQCSVFFCAQAFSASSNAGKPQQNRTTTFDRFDLSKDASSAAEWILSPPPPEMNIDNPSMYRVDNRSVEALYWEMLDLAGLGNVRPTKVPGTESPVLDFDNMDNSAGDVIEVIWKASNSTDELNQLFTTVANGFTAFIRTRLGAPPDLRYAPTVFTNEVVIAVRWAWLTFPLGLLLTAYVFLAAVILQTKQRPVRPWKGHRLSLLLAGVDEVVRNQAAGGFETRQGIEERLGMTRVRLQYDGGENIHFRKV